MTKQEFSHGMLRLRSAFSKAKIPPQEADSLFSELSFIPPQAWPPIVNQAIQKWDAWPKNFVKEVKDLWLSWLSSHPEHQAKKETTVCYQCHASSGYIWATKVIPDLSTPHRDYQATSVFRCAHCHNAQGNVGIPVYTRQQVSDMGYTIDDSGRYSPKDDLSVHKRKLPSVNLKSVPSSHKGWTEDKSKTPDEIAIFDEEPPF